MIWTSGYSDTQNASIYFKKTSNLAKPKIDSSIDSLTHCDVRAHSFSELLKHHLANSFRHKSIETEFFLNKTNLETKMKILVLENRDNLQVEYVSEVLDSTPQVGLPADEIYYHESYQGCPPLSSEYLKVKYRFSTVVHVRLWLHQDNWHLSNGTCTDSISLQMSVNE